EACEWTRRPVARRWPALVNPLLPCFAIRVKVFLVRTPRIVHAFIALSLLLAPRDISAGQDLVARALSTDERRAPRSLLADLEREADGLRGGSTPLDTLNAHFFGPSGFIPISDPASVEGSSMVAVLENRRGTCVTLAIVYLSMARQLGLDAHAVATPVHVFVRVRLPDRVRNVELMEGGTELDDDIYRRRYKIDQAAIDAGVFMRDLTDDDVIAHLLSNQGVALSKQGKPKDALRRYRKALRLHPQLPAARYNAGIDLMSMGKLKKALASFDEAISLHAADAQAHNNRGLVKGKLGDRAGAEADFRLALQLDPTLAEAERNLRRLSGR
ncbi:MAG: tetratricopeptide repeat protein, partial [Candidatus Polarisedimenticolia bacterium]